MKACLLLLALLPAIIFGVVASAETVDKSEPGTQIEAAALDEKINEVLGRPEFSWRMSREKDIKAPRRGVLDGFLQSVSDWIEKQTKRVARYVARFLDWMSKKMGRWEGHAPPAGWGWIGRVQTFLWILLGMVIVAVVLLLLRVWYKKRKGGIPIVSVPVVPASDWIESDDAADKLPADRWMALAEEFIGKGEYRLAMRAMFLAGLAHLSAGEMLIPARGKSNGEYLVELSRRGRDIPGLIDAFCASIRIVERSWYGDHPVDQEGISDFRAKAAAILAFRGRTIISAGGNGN